MKKLFDWIGTMLPDNAKESWKLYSVRLAAFVGTLTGVLTAQPEILIGLISIIPQDNVMRLFFSLGTAVVVFVVPWIVRIWPQGEKTDGE